MAERIIRVRVEELAAGDIIAKDVYSSSGSILIKKNMGINDLTIQKLLKNYNDYIYVYRSVNKEYNSYDTNINDIMQKQIEYIIYTTAQKFLKQNKDINQIKKIIFDILNNDNVIKLLMHIRPLGENVFNHSINVAIYALCVGKELSLPYNRLKILGTAALLHDVGMHRIPCNIIYKVEPLNDEEKRVLQLHPRHSFDILQETNSFNLEISSIVLQHHERFDGRGYPNRLKNDRIHQMAKIISLCDIFDALTSDRPYRQKFDKNESIEYLLNGENLYGQEILQGLINSISIYPHGQWVRLSTGETGVVVSQEELSSLNYRPVVMVYIDIEGNMMENPKLIDLSFRSYDNITIDSII